MHPVTFRFRPSVLPEKRIAVLRQIDDWQEVGRTGRLYPDAKNYKDELSFYAYVHEREHLTSVIARLAAIPEIEASSELPPRGLII